ncbi:hypothetical protein GGR53DRAFT_481987 [Hypoxylon sp. FL1150]|nr:hypothetical protein GGR53DRAFT_481987 [Hypoxylon sp. FL1150]
MAPSLPIPTELKAIYPPIGMNRKSEVFFLGDDTLPPLYTIIISRTRDAADSHFVLTIGSDDQGESIGHVAKPSRRDPDETKIAALNLTTDKWTATEMTRHQLPGTTRFLFEMIVETEWGMRIEKFEWRPATMGEATSIHPDRLARGFTMVRLGSNFGSNPKRGEMVAMWSVVDSTDEKRKRPFTFRLRGSGASGRLGPDFTIIALMSAIKIYSLDEPLMQAQHSCLVM